MKPICSNSSQIHWIIRYFVFISPAKKVHVLSVADHPKLGVVLVMEIEGLRLGHSVFVFKLLLVNFCCIHL